MHTERKKYGGLLEAENMRSRAYWKAQTRAGTVHLLPEA
jgi:hypothetical protein